MDDIHSIHSLGRMMADRLRTEPYVQALRQAVHPGSVVLNIGTGAGGQALLACKLGARRVYAIEPGDSIEVALAVARVMDGQAKPSIKAEFGQSTFFSSHPLSRRWLRNRPSEPVAS